MDFHALNSFKFAFLTQSFFGLSFGGGGEIDIILDDADNKKMAEVKDENGRKERFYLFYDGESVTGKVGLVISVHLFNFMIMHLVKVNVTLHRKTGKIEHNGIKIEFIGQIELYYDRGNHHEFLSLVIGCDLYKITHDCTFFSRLKSWRGRVS